MAGPASWTVNLKRAIEALEGAEDLAYVTAKTVMQILKISERQARRIILSMPNVQKMGNLHAVARIDAILWLRKMAGNEKVQQGAARRERLTKDLDIGAPRLLVPIPTETVIRQRIGTLPGAISITPGRIVIDFETTIEARELLATLAAAMLNDEAGFDWLASGGMEKMRARESDGRKRIETTHSA